MMEILSFLALVFFASACLIGWSLIFKSIFWDLPKLLWSKIPIGTRSVLIGAHCFFLHPFFVAAGWWKLYGFPWDPRLWVAFFIHDLGYAGNPNMDGEEGKSHPEFGAVLMHELFDSWMDISMISGRNFRFCEDFKWHDLCLYHSRYYAKKHGAQPSRLCFADKLAFPLTPSWLYIPMTTLTGEINEYLKNAQKADSGHWKPTGSDKKKWHNQLCKYMIDWVYAHKDGNEDTWTDASRNVKDESGVWK